VVVRSGDVTADITAIEGQVARKPVRTDESRPVMAAREARRPIAVGPTAPSHPLVAAKGPDAAEPAPVKEPPPSVAAAPKPPPPSVAVAPKQPPVEQHPPAREPPPRP